MALTNPWATRWDNEPPAHDDDPPGNDPLVDLTDDSSVGAQDGDYVLSSHPMALRNKLQKVSKMTELPPIWEWNGEDLSQFETPQVGSALDDYDIDVGVFIEMEQFGGGDGFPTVRIYGSVEPEASPDESLVNNLIALPIDLPYQVEHGMMITFDYAATFINPDFEIGFGAIAFMNMGDGDLSNFWKSGWSYVPVLGRYTEDYPDALDGAIFEHFEAPINGLELIMESNPGFPQVQGQHNFDGPFSGRRVAFGLGPFYDFYDSEMEDNFEWAPVYANNGMNHYQDVVFAYEPNPMHKVGHPAIGITGAPGEDFEMMMHFWNIRVWPLPRVLSMEI